MRALDLAGGEQTTLERACSPRWSVQEIATRELLEGKLDAQLFRASGACVPLQKVRMSVKSRKSLEAHLTDS